MEEGEGLLDDVAELVRALDVRGSLAGDDWQDAAFPRFMAVGVAVVSLVAQEGVRALARVADAAGDGRDAVDEGEGLRDVVDVGGGGDRLQRCTVPVADEVVLAAGFASVDWRGGGRLAPFFAFTWEASRQARVQSIWPAAFNSARSMRCSWSKTPASCHRPSLRQQV